MSILLGLFLFSMGACFGVMLMACIAVGKTCDEEMAKPYGSRQERKKWEGRALR